MENENSKATLNPETLKNLYAFWNDDDKENYTPKHSAQEVLKDEKSEEKKDDNPFSGMGSCGCGGGCLGGCGGGCL